MALVFTRSTSGQAAQPIALSGGYWDLIGTLTFSGSYATGGDTLDLTPYFPAGKTIRECIPLCDARGNSLEYDLTNKKLKVYASANTEAAAAAYNAALTASVVPVVFRFKG
jgi:hypothetical protein